MDYKQFASKIRAKYPGAYDQVDDRTLAEKVVAKYPQYQSKVEFGPGVSKMESFGRGAAQGLSLGFGDEMSGGAKAVRDYVLGNKSVFDKGIGDIYRRRRDESRAANLAAQQANPKTYLAGQLPGAIAPAIAATAGSGGTATPAVLARLGMLGAAEGLGYSQAEDVGGMARDVAVGGALGVAVPKGIQKGGQAIRGTYNLGKKAIGGTMRGAGAGGKQLASATFDVPVEALETKFAKPGAVRTAKTFAGLAESMPEDITRLNARIGKEADKAAAFLRPDVKAMDVQDVLAFIDQRATGALGPVDEAAARKLAKFGKSIQSKMAGKTDITETELKNMIKKADANINWKDFSAKPTNEAFKDIRVFMDRTLKQQNPQYKEAMRPVSVFMQVRDDLIDQFRLKEVRGGGYVPTDTTVTKLKQLPKEGKIQSARTAEQMKAATGRDYAEKARLAGAREAFDKGKLRTPLLGGALSGEGGGGRIAEKAVEMSAKASKTLDKILGVKPEVLPQAVMQYPRLFGQYAPILQRSAQRGAQNLAITHYTLQQMDPEYRKQLENIRERSRR